jgi:hypothetical protein
MVILIPFLLHSQGKITTPKQHLGFNVGEDYHLANYTQLVSYWNKLAQESDRLSLHDVGKSAEGRTMIMAIITSPENQKMLDKYKSISKRLALAEGLTDEEARKLAAEGKAVVWIDGGLHGTEVLGAQQLLELVFQMVSRSDRETLRILDDVILLTLCTNPDGMGGKKNSISAQLEDCPGFTRNTPDTITTETFICPHNPKQKPPTISSTVSGFLKSCIITIRAGLRARSSLPLLSEIPLITVSIPLFPWG